MGPRASLGVLYKIKNVAHTRNRTTMPRSCSPLSSHFIDCVVPVHCVIFTWMLRESCFIDEFTVNVRVSEGRLGGLNVFIYQTNFGIILVSPFTGR